MKNVLGYYTLVTLKFSTRLFNMQEDTLRLEIAKTMLLMRFPFFGYIVSRLNISRKDKIRSFAIDEHCNVFYNRSFLNKLSDANLLTVLAHEALHAVFMHFTHFSKDIDHSLMNLAMDIEINDILINIEKMDMPMSSIIGGKTKPDKLISGFAPDEDGNFTIIHNKKSTS